MWEVIRVFPRLSKSFCYVLLLAVPLCSGCTVWNRLRGAPEVDADNEEVATKFRPRADRSEPYFFDERARQIERNLGM